ncbi:MAG: hypothetical protein MJ196_07580 [Treponemataceae bacterium]|nr:hypothetical protein [Treponemataceae bacterium]
MIKHIDLLLVTLEWQIEKMKKIADSRAKRGAEEMTVKELEEQLSKINEIVFVPCDEKFDTLNALDEKYRLDELVKGGKE